MIWLSNSTLGKLRDKLRKDGTRLSLMPPSASEGAFADASGFDLASEFGPLAEAMFLMMIADGDISTAEHEVVRGALRNLSEGMARTIDIEAWLDAARDRIAREGRDKRLAQVASAMKHDRARAEVAFVLAAAVAFADSAIADEENDLLNTFAEALSIDEARANLILDELQSELVEEVRSS